MEGWLSCRGQKEPLSVQGEAPWAEGATVRAGRGRAGENAQWPGRGEAASTGRAAALCDPTVHDPGSAAPWLCDLGQVT